MTRYGTAAVPFAEPFGDEGNVALRAAGSKNDKKCRIAQTDVSPLCPQKMG
jgi:hypothetical protein